MKEIIMQLMGISISLKLVLAAGSIACSCQAINSQIVEVGVAPRMQLHYVQNIICRMDINRLCIYSICIICKYRIVQQVIFKAEIFTGEAKLNFHEFKFHTLQFQKITNSNACSNHQKCCLKSPSQCMAIMFTKTFRKLIIVRIAF